MKECCRLFLLLPFAMAVLGFSYALATGETRSAFERSSGSAAPRGDLTLTVPLRLTDPYLKVGSDPAFLAGGKTASDPNGFDLGDACVGQPFTRFLNATGGFMPYRFKVAPLLDPINTAKGLFDLPTLGMAGRLTGQGTNAGALRFNVLLTDFVGTQRLGIYRLNFLSCPANFRFSQDTLPFAQHGNSYYTRIETLGGSGDVKIELRPGTVSSAGVPIPSLETIGLTLTSDGTLYGRPTVKGRINFVLRATDAAGNVAVDRSNSLRDQPYALVVEGNGVANSEMLATSCTIHGNQVVPGSDTLRYSGVLDTKGDVAASLAGTPFTFRIGTTLVSGNFNDKGRVKVQKGKLKMTATIRGQAANFSISLAGTDISTAINARGFVNKTGANIIMAVELGSLRTCEVLNMDAAVRPGGDYRLSYSIGKRGYSVAGGMQITGIIGTDDKDLTTHQPGDGWLIRFIGIPRQGVDGVKASDVFTNPGGVTVHVGHFYTQTVNVTLKSVKQVFDSPTSPIKHFVLDQKTFMHEVRTRILTPLDTSLPQAIDAHDPTIFPLQLDVKGFKGLTGRVVAPNGRQWHGR